MCGTANRTARFVLDLRRDLRTAGFFFVHSTECFLREYPSRHFLRHVVVSCQRVCPAGQRLPDMREGMVVRGGCLCKQYKKNRPRLRLDQTKHKCCATTPSDVCL